MIDTRNVFFFFGGVRIQGMFKNDDHGFIFPAVEHKNMMPGRKKGPIHVTMSAICHGARPHIGLGHDHIKASLRPTALGHLVKHDGHRLIAARSSSCLGLSQ